VPRELEWDTRDAEAIHVLAEDAAGRPLGTARLLATGQIGRMAVLADWRSRGIGRGMLRMLLQLARKERLPPPWLNAQTTAVGFYRRAGFVEQGEQFLEAGIPHCRMALASPTERSSRPLDLGEGVLELRDLEQIRQVGVSMLEQARVQVLLFSQDLDPMLFDQLPLLQALQRLAVRQTRRAQVRILLLNHRPLIKRRHRMLELSRRLTSSIELRRPKAEYRERSDEFLVVDQSAYLHREQPGVYQALASYHDPLRARRLQTDFLEIWEHSDPDPEIRRLYL